MNKIELTLKEAVDINGNTCRVRGGKTSSIDKINFDIQNGKLLGWEIDGRKLAVSAKPNEVVEPQFCNMVEVLDTVGNIATYYDKVAKHVENVTRANAKLEESIKLKHPTSDCSESIEKAAKELQDDKHLDDLIRRVGEDNIPFYSRGKEYMVEPPVDPVLATRSVVQSPIGSASMSGLVHYFVPVNEAAKEVQGKPCSEGLLTKEQLDSLLGK